MMCASFSQRSERVQTCCERQTWLLQGDILPGNQREVRNGNTNFNGGNNETLAFVLSNDDIIGAFDFQLRGTTMLFAPL